jgi:hypothetical protein
LITADSLDVQLPNQKVREVHAIGQAYAETTPDSTKLKSDQRDWLRGDTIVASFDSAAVSDTSSRPRIRELLAISNASSFYQVASNKSRTAPPSLNYVRGKTITVGFDSQAVQSVVVEEQAAGVFLEPSDSTTVKPRPRPGTPTPKSQPARPSPARPTPRPRDHE